MTLDRQMKGIVRLGEERLVQLSARGKGEVIMQLFQTTPPHMVT